MACHPSSYAHHLTHKRIPKCKCFFFGWLTAKDFNKDVVIDAEYCKRVTGQSWIIPAFLFKVWKCDQLMTEVLWQPASDTDEVQIPSTIIFFYKCCYIVTVGYRSLTVPHRTCAQQHCLSTSVAENTLVYFCFIMWKTPNTSDQHIIMNRNIQFRDIQFSSVWYLIIYICFSQQDLTVNRHHGGDSIHDWSRWAALPYWTGANHSANPTPTAAHATPHSSSHATTTKAARLYVRR